MVLEVAWLLALGQTSKGWESVIKGCTGVATVILGGQETETAGLGGQGQDTTKHLPPVTTFRQLNPLPKVSPIFPNCTPSYELRLRKEQFTFKL